MKTSTRSRATQVFVALACLMIAAMCALSFGVNERAYADGAPTNTLYLTSEAESITPGDEFDVSLVVERDGETVYQMYAFSATLAWDSSMVELVRYDSTILDAYVTESDGLNNIVLNYWPATLSGKTWESPKSVLTMTFKAVDEGDTTISFKRVNVSNSTGMGRYASTCTDAVLTIAAEETNEPVLTPSDEASDGTTEGTNSPEADTSTAPTGSALLELTPEEREELVAAGYDVNLLIQDAMNKGQISEQEYKDYAKNAGDTATNGAANTSGNAGAANAGANANASGTSNGASGEFPVGMVVGVIAVIAIVAIAAFVVASRRKKGGNDAA